VDLDNRTDILTITCTFDVGAMNVPNSYSMTPRFIDV
jgi:hypothetical protein